MVIHTHSGGTLKVMGLLLEKVTANTMIVMDSFALSVEETEIKVNAQAQAYEYITAYIETAKQLKSREHNFFVFINILKYPYRSANKRMLLASIIVIQVMDVGCLILMYLHKCLVKIFKNHLLLL
ncbi:COP9 signalosome complex subunit 5-like [Vespa crabro]|uniref:COP9 signalosome complex subunit 5-like n=1 Tax=Vespa crabro TaxID=7445 RepID=UPI001F0249CC|nr:COP9 signalosome complex subunit 5-like [Vespa crabro]